MRKREKHISSLLSIVLAFIVVVSTSGFKLYTHQCSTSQIQNVSIIIPAEACGHPEQAEEHKSCCLPIEEVPEDNCCKLSEPFIEDDNCCTDIEKYIKLDIETLLNHATPIVKVNEMSSFIALFTFSNLVLDKTVETNIIKHFIKPPPSKLLPYYLSFIQVYLI